LFADDLVIFIDGDDTDILIDKMNDTLLTLDNWCTNNGLQINYQKTEYMIFDYKPNANTHKELIINNVKIKKVQHFKYLGVIFDSKLKFHLQIDKIESKVYSAIGGIRKLKKLINIRVLSTLINSYIISITDFCLPIWGWSAQNDLDRIQNKINNLLITFFHPSLEKFHYKKQWAKISKLPPSEQKTFKLSCHRLHKNINMNDLLERCNLLTLNERLIIASATAIFKSIKFENDVIELKDFFELSSERNTQVRTRSCTSNGISLPTFRLSQTKKSIRYSSIKFWNELPTTIRNTNQSLLTFKDKLERHIIKMRENIYVYY